jgi:Zn-finger nucleic acid-binding protein
MRQEARLTVPIMKCPACGNALSARRAGSIDVDVCDGGCGGVWFDNFELRKIDESGVEAIRDVPRDSSLRVDESSRRRCPKCADQMMLRRFFSRLRRTQIDECPNCAGIWLDAGEFDAIQAELAQSPDTVTLNAALNHTVSLLRGRSGM